MRIKINEEKVRKVVKKAIFFMKIKDLLRGKKFVPPMDESKEIPEMLLAIGSRPDIARKMMPFQKKIYFDGEIERELKEKIFTKVSKINSCQFCTVVHEGLVKELGLEEEGVTDREKVALEYAEQVTKDSNMVSDDLYKRVQEHFSDGEIVELTLAIGIINLLNSFNNALQIRAEA